MLLLLLWFFFFVCVCVCVFLCFFLHRPECVVAAAGGGVFVGFDFLGRGMEVEWGEVGRYNLRVFNPAGSFVSVCYSRNVGPCFLEILTNQAYEWSEITAIIAVIIPALMLPGGIFHLWGSSLESPALILKTCLVQQQLGEIKAESEVLLFCCRSCCCFEISVE